MSETEPNARERPTATEVEFIPELANLVIGVSRLLGALASLPAFRSRDFRMADWVALSILAKDGQKNNWQLSKSLGVTRQRANQIKTSLENARLVSASQSDEDGRKNVLVVTDRGHAYLIEIDEQLQLALAALLKGKERVLVRSNKAIRILIRGLRDGTEGKQKPRQDRLSGKRRPGARQFLNADQRPRRVAGRARD
jgi:DNA-binding MarR family transcriptional regulator